MQAVLMGHWDSWDPGIGSLLGAGQRDRSDNIAERALDMALLAMVLGDRTAVPADQIEVQEQDRRVRIGNVWQNNRVQADGTPLKPAADLRWCDVAAYQAADNPWRFRVGHGRPDDLVFDLSAPLAERDTQLAALRAAIDPAITAACTAAKLPIPAGGAAPAAGDKALF
jgi:hypothetical protein